MEAIDRVIALAEAEVGYHEKASAAGLDKPFANTGAGNFTKYARDLDAVAGFYNGPKQGYAWCDVFVDWLFARCFGAEKARELLYQPVNSAGAGCTFSAAYYRAGGAFIPRSSAAGEGTGAPQPGDQIFFGTAACSTHTGLVIAVADGRVTTIEGNSSDQVAKRSYALDDSNIYGYGRPKWSAVGDSETPPAGTSSGNSAPETEASADSGGAASANSSGDPVTADTSADSANSSADSGINSAAQSSTDTKTQASRSAGDPVPKSACVTVSLPELEPGDIGREVQTLQALLKGYGCDPGEVDGDFGPNTRQAVESYQSSRGLAVDGICGKNTWMSLLLR